PWLALRAGDASTPFRAFAPAAVPMVQHAEGVLLATLATLPSPATPTPSNVAPAQRAQVKETFGKLPLTFEQNVGQTDESVQFFARGPGYGLYLTGTEAVMVLQQPTAGRTGAVRPLVPDAADDWMRHQGAGAPRAPEAPPAVVRLQLVGGNATP